VTAGDDQQGSAISEGTEERRIMTADDDQQGSAISEGTEEWRT